MVKPRKVNLTPPWGETSTEVSRTCAKLQGEVVKVKGVCGGMKNFNAADAKELGFVT